MIKIEHSQFIVRMDFKKCSFVKDFFLMIKWVEKYVIDCLLEFYSFIFRLKFLGLE